MKRLFQATVLSLLILSLFSCKKDETTPGNSSNAVSSTGTSTSGPSADGTEKPLIGMWDGFEFTRGDGNYYGKNISIPIYGKYSNCVVHNKNEKVQIISITFRTDHKMVYLSNSDKSVRAFKINNGANCDIEYSFWNNYVENKSEVWEYEVKSKTTIEFKRLVNGVSETQQLNYSLVNGLLTLDNDRFKMN